MKPQVFVALSCLVLLIHTSVMGVDIPTAVRVKVVPAGQPTTAAHQPILTLPAVGPVSATLVVEPFGFTPTSFMWSQVKPASSAFLASADAVSFVGAMTSTSPQIVANFPSRGVYQLQVAATNGTVSARQYVWVQVWDNLAGLNSLQRVGRNPGINPPTSVRQFSPDPGPGHHPRLLFTNADWTDLSTKAVNAPNVLSAITSLNAALNGNFDKITAPLGALRTTANQLISYHDSSYDSAIYASAVYPAAVTSVSNGAPNFDGRWTGSNLLGRSPNDCLADALTVAAYLAWIGTDPTLAHTSVPANAQARFRELCKIVSAFAHARMLIANGGSPTSPTHDLALVYDLLYDWMTDAERADVRDYLYAIGYGFINSGGGGLARGTVPVPSQYFANGDFPNLADPVILSALAIEGEENQVSATVIAANVPAALPVTDATGWPGASPATVWNLYRQARWFSDFNVTSWGTPVEHHAYLELSMTNAAPAMLALARRGQNAFITANVYQASLHALGMLYARQSDGAQVMWDHHDGTGFGNGSGTNNGRYVLKYMYPDDPLIDYVHRAFRNEGGNSLPQAIFDTTPGAMNLAAVAQAKGLSPTRLDPFSGAAWTRNTWDENDLSLYFECRADVVGHMHAEANNFSLYALGRAWSSPPGYHVTINDASATVLVQDPTLVGDAATEGYIGESSSSAKLGYFPTPPAKFLEATEDPAGKWTLFAGDATSAYQYGFQSGQPNTNDTGRKTLNFFYDGWINQLSSSERAGWDHNFQISNVSYNPMQYALRTVLSVRGARPYVLVIDDISVNGTTPRNYRWNMPAAISFGGSGGRFVGANNYSVFSSLTIQPGATPTEAVLYHSPKDDASGPRLLVRDVAQVNNAAQPAIILDKRNVNDPRGNLSYGVDNNSGQLSVLPTCRLLITRQNVVSPGFKVLLFPYLTGQAAPTTTWNGNTLTVNTGSAVDTLNFDSSRPDHRTRMVSFARSQTGHVPPTLNVPADIVTDATGATSFNGQPGVAVTFSVTAADENNASLPPTVSTASGTVFPAGIHTITASAQDSLGQVTTKRFTVTVRPPPPTVTVKATTNFPGATDGVQLRWTPVLVATAYSVKRATTPGGTYTVVSDRQTAYSFGESGIADGTYYYEVTSWLNDQEGLPCAPISVAPPITPLTPILVGPNVQESGVYQSGSSYLLTTKYGASGVWTDSMVYASMPWTGDGTFSVRLAELNGFGANVSSFANVGLSLRASTDGGAISAFSGLGTYAYSPNSFYRTATSARASSGSGIASHVALPFWIRLVRAGSAVSAFYSLDGSAWAPHNPTSVTLSNLPTSTVVGLGFDAQNGTLASARFDNIAFLKTPTVNAAGTSITLDWTGSQANRYAVQRSASVAGPFTSLATNLSATSYIDSGLTPKTGYFYTVTALSEDGYSTTSPVVRVLLPQTVTVALTPVSVPADGQVHLPPVVLTPSLDAGAVLSWSWSGTGVTDATLPPTAVGNYTVTATVSGTQTGTATTTVVLTTGGIVVTPTPVTFTIPARTNAVYDGSPHPIATPSVTVSTGASLILRYRSFTGDPSAGGTAVSGSLWITTPPLEPGWYSVEARLTGAQSGTATGSLFIDQATPSVTWATPAAVTGGTALGATQFNATSLITGNFVYTPATGTLASPAGSLTLSSLFIPVDSVHYRSVTTTVTLSVTAIPVTVIVTSVPAVPYDGLPHSVGVLLTPAAPAASVSVTYQPWSGDPADVTTSATAASSASAPVTAGWYRAVATAGGSCSGTASGSVDITPASSAPGGAGGGGGGSGGGGTCGLGGLTALILAVMIAATIASLRRRSMSHHLESPRHR